jgi:hypothetical protein
MKPGCEIPESNLAQLREACCAKPCLAAIYIFGRQREGDCDLAALFTEGPSWDDRLELELAVAKAMGQDGVELIDLKRMPLVFRFGVVNEGEPIYVGQPDVLANFIEETIARYAAFYPLLEALYWKVETRPVPEDMLGDVEHNASNNR